MKKIHRRDSIVEVVRFYDSPIDTNLPIHKISMPYSSMLILQLMDDGTVRASSSIIAPTKKQITSLCIDLANSGYIKAYWRHKNKKELVIDLTKYKSKK